MFCKRCQLGETCEDPHRKLRSVKRSANLLRIKHRELWFEMNKPFGWEVLEVRYGGLIMRTETAQSRIKQWINDRINRIEELEEERLYFEGPYPMPEGSLGRNIYRRIVTAGNLT
ncbi:hypothetical protein ACFSTA_14550 [Ornithinibacillus salinisoli]|uniref:Glycoside Hydrolase 20C C-terminal domain-containing protein n=1 Tax=Ornithinibacillus salinisoli TaxID=1848459 RepID=A0ABW4W0N4_9BACI